MTSRNPGWLLVIWLLAALLLHGGCVGPVDEPAADPDRRPTADPAPFSGSDIVIFTSYEHSSSQIYRLQGDGSAPANLSATADDGEGEGLFPAGDFMPDLSGDGERIVFGSNQRPGGSLFTMNPDGGGISPVDTDGLQAVQPRWSPAGRLVLFRGGYFGDQNAVWIVDTEGSAFPGVRQLTFPEPGQSDRGGVAFLSDSKDFVFSRWSGDQFDLLRAKTFDSGVDPVPVTDTADRSETLPARSPDGTRLAYAVDAHLSGQGTIEIRSIGDLNGAVQSVGFAGLSYRTIGGLSFSSDGSALVVSLALDDPADMTPPAMAFELVWVPLDGSPPVRLTDNDYADVHPSMAPGSSP